MLVYGVALGFIVVVAVVLFAPRRRRTSDGVSLKCSLFVARSWTTFPRDDDSFGFFYTVDDLKAIVDLGLPGKTQVWQRAGDGGGLFVEWKDEPNVDLGVEGHAGMGK